MKELEPFCFERKKQNQTHPVKVRNKLQFSTCIEGYKYVYVHISTDLKDQKKSQTSKNVLFCNQGNCGNPSQLLVHIQWCLMNDISKMMWTGKKTKIILRARLVKNVVLVGKDIEQDAVGRQFEPFPYRRLSLHRWSPWDGQG